MILPLPSPNLLRGAFQRCKCPSGPIMEPKNLAARATLHVTKVGRRSCDPFQEDGTFLPEAFLVDDCRTGKERNIVECIRYGWHQQLERRRRDCSVIGVSVRHPSQDGIKRNGTEKTTRGQPWRTPLAIEKWPRLCPACSTEVSLSSLMCIRNVMTQGTQPPFQALENPAVVNAGVSTC